jgi:hypothetical protein
MFNTGKTAVFVSILGAMGGCAVESTPSETALSSEALVLPKGRALCSEPGIRKVDDGVIVCGTGAALLVDTGDGLDLGLRLASLGPDGLPPIQVDAIDGNHRVPRV